MDAGFVSTPEDIREQPSDDMIKEFRQLIGSTGYAAICCRFDNSFAVSTLSRHLMKPNKKVINKAKPFIRYLSGIVTRDFFIRCSSSPEYVDENMRNVALGAVDTSYAACLITRRQS